MVAFFSGGFYSDTVGYLGKTCKRCPNGSFVAYEKTPGKHHRDCKSCPLGKDSNQGRLVFSLIINLQRETIRPLNMFYLSRHLTGLNSPNKPEVDSD